MSIKNILLNIIRNFYLNINKSLNFKPNLRLLIYSFYDKIRLFEYKIKNTLFKDSFEQDNCIIHINPKRIIYEKNLNKNNWRLFLKFIKPLLNFKGKETVEIIDGDWDLENLRYFDKDIKHISYNMHFIEGLDWKDTPYYKREKKLYLDGESRIEYKSVDDLDLKYKYLDNLYEKIKREGFKTQKEVIESDGIESDYGRGRLHDDDITIAIGRNGDVIFLDGRHRLNIAKILNLKKIPVRVLIIHPKLILKLKSKSKERKS